MVASTQDTYSRPSGRSRSARSSVRGAHGGGPVVPVRPDPGLGRSGDAHPDQGPRPEALLVVVDEGDGHRLDVGHPGGGGRQGDAGGPGAQWLEDRLVVADALGEDGHHPPARQQPVAAGEGPPVALRGAPVLGAVDGHHAPQLQEGPQEGIAEQGRLAQEPRIAVEGAHQQEAVDQSVPMVGHHHGRSTRDDPLAVLHLDLSEEAPGEQPGQAAHGQVTDGTPGAPRVACGGPGVRGGRHICTSSPDHRMGDPSSLPRALTPGPRQLQGQHLEASASVLSVRLEVVPLGPLVP